VQKVVRRPLDIATPVASDFFNTLAKGPVKTLANRLTIQAERLRSTHGYGRTGTLPGARTRALPARHSCGPEPPHRLC
jgi:hypothetical protein